MAGNAFTFGVKPGGLTENTEVRILLCYLIKTVAPMAPLTRAEIEQALSFGEKVSSSWHDGTVIKGRITRAFLTYLTKLEKPEADVYNKMTPFFTIRLGDVLSSEHYGTEIIISNPPDRAQDSIERILSSMEQLVVVHRNL